MYVEGLCLNFSGGDGREPGVIIALKEAPDGKTIKWGIDEGPPLFFRFRIDNTSIADLPAQIREYGEHRSRFVLRKERLPAATQAMLAEGKKPQVARAHILAALDDLGVNWKPRNLDELVRAIAGGW